MASYRHLARIAVMQTLFSYQFRHEKLPPDLESNCREFADKLTDLTFAKSLLNGVIEHQEEIRGLITKEAPEWPFERIALIDRVIISMGAYEILYSKDVPPVVAINEAIEISKVFGDINSSKFVNGVLSTIMNKYKPEGNNRPASDKTKPKAAKKASK
jgi:transcription antitermination protein NusB